MFEAPDSILSTKKNKLESLLNNDNVMRTELGKQMVKKFKK